MKRLLLFFILTAVFPSALKSNNFESVVILNFGRTFLQKPNHLRNLQTDQLISCQILRFAIRRNRFAASPCDYPKIDRRQAILLRLAAEHLAASESARHEARHFVEYQTSAA